ncbi:MAG: 16S rRNA processing protein RimM [Chloroflexi bacterium]|nr:16S rRNA processing protein RimM [Chloroflexota bacterium]
MTTPPPYLLLGEILRPHGVAGELKVRVLTAYPERVPSLKTVYIGRDPESPQAVEYGVQGVRFHQSYLLLKLRGVDDRNRAELLREMFVMVSLDNAVPLEEGEVYLFQLIGLTVRTTDGKEIGEIVEVLETGANDVYIVDSPQYGEVLLPATAETVIETDLASRFVIMKLPEGLLPDR